MGAIKWWAIPITFIDGIPLKQLPVILACEEPLPVIEVNKRLRVIAGSVEYSSTDRCNRFLWERLQRFSITYPARNRTGVGRLHFSSSNSPG
jgi:hypothetical protein